MGARVRLYNPDWNNLTTQEHTLYRKDEYGNSPQMFHIFYKGTSNANATELGGAADNALDGTTTPIKISVESASADDNDASNGHVRAIAVIGVSVASQVDYLADREDPVYSVEEFRMNGTTMVYSTRYYLRVIHAYAIEWGTGDTDAAGTITIEDGRQQEEISTVTCIAKASMDASDYFQMYSADGDDTETAFYVWYDLNDGDGDPGGTGTGIECAIHGDTTAEEVAATTVTAINGSAAEVTATRSGAVVTITNDNHGAVTDTVDSDTGFTFATTQQGVAIGDTIATIAAAANESNGSAIYGCVNHRGRWRYIRLGAHDVAFNNA